MAASLTSSFLSLWLVFVGITFSRRALVEVTVSSAAGVQSLSFGLWPFNETPPVCEATATPTPHPHRLVNLSSGIEALAPQGQFDWSETDRSKAWANTGLIEGDVWHRGRLRIEPRDRWGTINLCKRSLNSTPVLHMPGLIKKSYCLNGYLILISLFAYVFYPQLIFTRVNVAICLCLLA